MENKQNDAITNATKIFDGIKKLPFGFRVASAAKNIGYITKTSAGNNGNYAGAEVIYPKVNEEFANWGIYKKDIEFVPHTQEDGVYKSEDRNSKSGGNIYYFTQGMYRLVLADGLYAPEFVEVETTLDANGTKTCRKELVAQQTLEVVSPVYGQQTQDPAKAIGTGWTYADRYAISKILNIPIGGDDPDRKTNEADYRQQIKNIYREALETSSPSLKHQAMKHILETAMTDPNTKQPYLPAQILVQINKLPLETMITLFENAEIKATELALAAKEKK